MKMGQLDCPKAEAPFVLSGSCDMVQYIEIGPDTFFQPTMIRS